MVTRMNADGHLKKLGKVLEILELVRGWARQ